MELGEYAEYKDSEIEWIGEIPCNWDLKRIKDSTYLKARIGWQGLRSEEFQDEGDYYCITGTDFEDGLVNWKNTYFVSKERYEQDKFIQLQKDDLLITKDGSIGKLAIVEKLRKPSTLNTGVFVLRPLNNIYLTKFMYWLMSSDVFTNFIEIQKYGSTIQHLYQNDLIFFSFPCPDILTQKKIIKFLNIKTIKIKSMIKLLIKKIRIFEDFKRSLINQTVCNGLNQNIKLKETGIKWIGEIPNHWNVVRLKDIFQIKKRTVGNKSDDYELLSLTQNGVIHRDIDSGFGKFPDSFDTYQIVEPDDLIFCLFDMDVTPRTVGISEYNGMITGAYTIVKPLKDVSNKYYYYLFLMADNSKKLSLYYTGLRNSIRKERFLSMSIPIFSKSEQNEIVSYLDEKISKIDKIISKISSQINLLEEFRKTLITDVVTGKVKVIDE